MAMSDGENRPRNVERGSFFNPWIVALITAPIPLLLFLLFLYKWHQQKTESERVKGQFIERQNTALAYEALEVSRRVAELLEIAVRDAQTLSLIPPTPSAYEKFYRSHVAKVTRYDESTNAVRLEQVPVYNELVYLDGSGAERLRLASGKITQSGASLSACSGKDLCDKAMREATLKLSPSEIRVGGLMRLYSPKGVPEREEGAHLPVAFRAANGIFIVGIDYRQLREILYMPTFPYHPKKDLFRSYLEGNYIYFVNSEYEFIAHPKYWHVTGIDPDTGLRVPGVVNDTELEKRPLNHATYRGEKLGDYFHRLMTVSFTQRSVDVFQAPNLTGTIRVLSVAPIIFSRAQFAKTGIFGHVIVGCNVDYFAEPKERVEPYY